MRKDLLKWQWEGYPQFHQSASNLIFHLPGVTAFISGTLSLLLGLLLLNPVVAIVGLVSAVVGFAVQAIGHKQEANPPIPLMARWTRSRGSSVSSS